MPAKKPAAAPGELIHIKGTVWLLTAEFNGRFPRCHCVYIDDGGGALVDTGAGLPVIAEFIRRHPVELVLNTHTHVDHVFGNHLLAGREILVPEAGWDTAGDLVKLSRRFVPREIAGLWREVIHGFTNWVDHRPTGTFASGQEITVGSTRLKAVAAPGHLSDHHMFHLPDLDLLLSADLDLTPFGPWYGNPESDLGQLRASFDLVGELDPSVVVSSHARPVFSGIAEAFDRYASVLDQREERLRGFLAEERTWEQVLDQRLIYGKSAPFNPTVMRFFEDRMLGLHRDDLAARGLVRATGRGWVQV